MNDSERRKRVEIEVPPEVERRAEERAEEQGGFVENYLLDEYDVQIEWVFQQD